LAAAGFAVADLGLVIEPSAPAAARRSQEESGCLLPGEVHGVRENPLVIRASTGRAPRWAGPQEGLRLPHELADPDARTSQNP